VLISEADRRALGLDEGQAIELRSPSGRFRGRLRTAAIVSGNLAVHWPEGNELLSGRLIDPASKEPDYNATVTLHAVEEPSRHA
jgi:anaerobic selenocysteine-containing dehydrogenase